MFLEFGFVQSEKKFKLAPEHHVPKPQNHNFCVIFVRIEKKSAKSTQISVKITDAIVV